MKTQLKNAAGNLTGEFFPTVVQTSSLNEELGQVNYVLTDKTGTLTQNKMVFHDLIVGKHVFSDVEVINDKRVQDPHLVNSLTTPSKEKDLLFGCMRCLTLCHSVIFDDQMNWNSCSAEELAFLRFAGNYGFIYQTHEVVGASSFQIVNELAAVQKYKLLEKFDFTSERRRMSVIVELNGEVFIYTKGADDILQTRLDEDLSKDLDSVLFQVERIAQQGHRMMMLAFKEINRADWFAFHLEYVKYKNDPNGIDKILEFQSQLENKLVLLGAVAIEDKLQDLAPESIRFIREAGIKLWMITGDKSQTALAVAKNSGLVTENMDPILFEDKNLVSESHLAQASRSLKGLSKSQKAGCLVHGTYLSTVFELRYIKKEIYLEFVRIMMKMDVAIFARISPRQKQEIVKMIRDWDDRLVTLAIGDGANDVNMISGAHIGVGIKGTEGNQAARASDYHFGEFKHLVPLMFFFGKECYRRNSNVVLFIFYKNIMIVMAQFWYGFFNFFSGQPLYEPWIYQLYNILFSFFPIFVYGIFDKSASKMKLLSSVNTYKPGLDNYHFNDTRVVGNLVLSFLVSLYLMITSLVFFDWGNYANGWTYGFWNFGNMCYFGVVIVVNIKILSISNSFSVILFLFVLLGIFLFVLFWFLINLSLTNVLYATFNEILQGYQIWIYLVVVFGICGLEYMIVKMEHLLMEVQYLPKIAGNNIKPSFAQGITRNTVQAPGLYASNEDHALGSVMDDSFEDKDRAKRNMTINSDEEL